MSTVKCNQCGSIVELYRTDHGQLLIQCDCYDVSIKVSKATPEEWQ